MKIFNCLLAATFSIGIGLAMVSAVPALAVPAQVAGETPDYGYGPNGPHPMLRALINRTQNDLRMAQRLEPSTNGDAASRYEHAQKHLSSFDRKLLRGHFDKDNLNDAISDISHILEKNTLQVSSRNALSQDIEQLRIVRSRR